jgi:hypothetical protein
MSNETNADQGELLDLNLLTCHYCGAVCIIGPPDVAIRYGEKKNKTERQAGIWTKQHHPSHASFLPFSIESNKVVAAFSPLRSSMSKNWSAVSWGEFNLY